MKKNSTRRDLSRSKVSEDVKESKPCTNAHKGQYTTYHPNGQVTQHCYGCDRIKVVK